MRQFSRIEAALTIAARDQQEAEFDELFTSWLKSDNNFDRHDDLMSGDFPPNPFKALNPTHEMFVEFLARDGLCQTRFGDLLQDEEAEFIAELKDWLKVDGNQERLASVDRKLGAFHQLLIAAFLDPNPTNQELLNCFAAHRLNQLSLRILAEAMTENEEGSIDEL